MHKRFFETKRLDEMTSEEWESLCDGCARCCLHKLEDEDTGDLYYTRVACRLLDLDSCRCRDYANREARVPDCVALGPGMGDELLLLPPTCAYRLLYLGQPLPDWHPLLSGDPQSVHRAGISVRGRALSERVVGPADEDSPIYDLG